MTATANTSTRSSTPDTTRAIREAQSPAPEKNPIPVNEDKTLNLPLSVELERCRGILKLNGKSPFTREQWFQLLESPFVEIPECLQVSDPFLFDLEYFKTHPEHKSFSRHAQDSELRSCFWQTVGADRYAMAVVVRETVGSFTTYFVSLPMGGLNEAVRAIRVHAATTDTVNPAMLES